MERLRRYSLFFLHPRSPHSFDKYLIRSLNNNINRTPLPTLQNPNTSPTNPNKSNKPSTCNSDSLPLSSPPWLLLLLQESELPRSIDLSRKLTRPRTVTVYACPTSTSSTLGYASSTIASTGVVTAATATGSPITYATGAASMNGVSALGLFVAGGVALVSSPLDQFFFEILLTLHTALVNTLTSPSSFDGVTTSGVLLFNSAYDPSIL
jgi:hypothetical protein